MLGVGQRIGNYRVLRKLGQGGMGAVFEALHEEIGRRAAIKILLPEFASDQSNIQRFFNEARAVNIIQHPGLVGVFESGRLDDGAAYIVMEYLEGELLSTRLNKLGALPVRTAQNLIRQIASALAAAHAKRIVHRDLKPENIMLVPDPETPDGERIKVFDFGIAKLVADSLRPQSPGGVDFRTQTGMIMGTPTHMAPEQVRGLTDIGGKADVYSLGVIFYQLLVGHPPFLAQSAGELLSMHLRDQPTPLRKIDPNLPEPVAQLVHRMLSKEPLDRPEMVEVMLELESMGASKRNSIAAAPESVSVVRERSGAVRLRPQGQTLQQAAGQTFSTVVANRRFALAVGVSATLVALSAVLLFSDLSSCGRHGDPYATGFDRNGQPVGNVHWTIDSDPSGADVIDAESGRVLGRTRWSSEEKRGIGQTKVRVRLRGYSDQSVILDRASNTDQTVYLLPTRAPVGADSAPPDAAARVTQPAPLVRWSIASKPRGAEIVRADDGAVLGKTPWEQAQEAGTGTLKVVLRKPGYVETPLLLDRASDMKQMILLQPSGPRRKRAIKEDDIPLFDAEEPGGEPARAR